MKFNIISLATPKKIMCNFSKWSAMLTGMGNKVRKYVGKLESTIY